MTEQDALSAEAQIYEESWETARNPDPGVRCMLEANPETPAEILYFLAGDSETEVRRAVAGNPMTPRQAE